MADLFDVPHDSPSRPNDPARAENPDEELREARRPVESLADPLRLRDSFPKRSIRAWYLHKMMLARVGGIEMGMAESAYVASGLTDWEAAALIQDGHINEGACHAEVREKLWRISRPGFPDEVVTVESVSATRKLLQEEHDLFEVNDSRNGRDVHSLRRDPSEKSEFT